MSIVERAQLIAAGFKSKADHNKIEALWCFGIALGSSLLAPLFITLGKCELYGKIIPSVLSVLAAGLTSWLQLRKPQKLWSLYRGCQRLIEDQLLKYEYKVDEFYTASEPDVLLAGKVAEIALNAHHQWTDIIPSPENMATGGKNKHGKRI